MQGRIFHQRDVGDHSAARQRAFQQIVAQDLLLRQAPGQYGVHGRHMQQAFAAERALGKHILINLRRGRAVRVNTALPAKEPVKRRGRLRARQRRRDARLQDGIARQHAAARHIHAGLIQRVRRHTHQRAQRSRRQHGVTVESDYIQRASHRVRVRAQVHEGRISGGLGQHAQQLLQLAALALPAHPALLRVRPGALAVQK